MSKDEFNIPFVSVRQSRAPHPDFHHNCTYYYSLHRASPSSNLNIYSRGQILLVVLGLPLWCLFFYSQYICCLQSHMK